VAILVFARDSQTYDVMKQAVEVIIDNLKIGPEDNRVAVVDMTGGATGLNLRIRLDAYSDNSSLVAAVRGLTYSSQGGPNMVSAFNNTNSVIFTTAAGGRVNPDVIVVLTDSPSAQGSETAVIQAAGGVKASGIDIFSIGIQGQVPESLLRGISSGNQERLFNYFLPEASEIPGQMGAYIQTACGVLGCPSSLVDLVIVLDNSGSIEDPNVGGAPGNFQKIKNFLNNIVQALNNRGGIGPDGNQVGLVEFGNDARNVFYLNTHDTLAGIDADIEGLAHRLDNTNTSAGLIQMRTVQYTEARGDRPGVRNVCLLLTDGGSTVNVGQTIPEARAAQSQGIEMLTVGVSQNVRLNMTARQEVIDMSSPPRKENENYWVDLEIAELNEAVIDQIIERTSQCEDDGVTCRMTFAGLYCFCQYSACDIRPINGTECQDIDECSFDPCEQTCNNNAGSYTCGCRQGFQLNINGFTCDDINECNRTNNNPNACAANEICVNTWGNYYCISGTGNSNAGLGQQAAPLFAEAGAAAGSGVSGGTLIGSLVLTATVAIVAAIAIVFIAFKVQSLRSKRATAQNKQIDEASEDDNPQDESDKTQDQGEFTHV
jgi:hypothetical protein